MSYHRPYTISGALNIMAEETEILKPIAGCTDVSVGKQEKVLKGSDYIDLSYIKELNFIEEKDGYINIGSATTHAGAAESPILQEKAPVLPSACITVGSPQIRNRGTIGGNICHASPSGDSIPALYVLNAEVKIENIAGERWVPISEFFTGPGKTVRKNDELVTALRFKPLEKTYRTRFIKLGQRKSLSCSKVSLAFCADIKDGKLSDVRIAMGAVAPTVIRAPLTEEFLEGNEINDEVIRKACELISTEAKPISDVRSTDKYRKNMVAVLLEKALSGKE